MLSPSSTQLTMLDTSSRNVSRVEIQHWVGEGEQQRFLKRVAVTNTRLDLHNSSYHTQLHSVIVYVEQVKEQRKVTFRITFLVVPAIRNDGNSVDICYFQVQAN